MTTQVSIPITIKTICCSGCDLETLPVLPHRSFHVNSNAYGELSVISDKFDDWTYGSWLTMQPGYGSDMDGRQTKFFFCPTCYGKAVKHLEAGFKPASIKEL